MWCGCNYDGRTTHVKLYKLRGRGNGRVLDVVPSTEHPNVFILDFPGSSDPVQEAAELTNRCGMIAEWTIIVSPIDGDHHQLREIIRAQRDAHVPASRILVLLSRVDVLPTIRRDWRGKCEEVWRRYIDPLGVGIRLAQVMAYSLYDEGEIDEPTRSNCRKLGVPDTDAVRKFILQHILRSRDSAESKEHIRDCLRYEYSEEEE